MNESDPNFVGPRLPDYRAVPGLSLPKDGPSPAGSRVRDYDLIAWKSDQNQLADEDGGNFDDRMRAAKLGNSAITRMLSGKLPKSAGRFTAEVSDVLCSAYKYSVDLSRSSAYLMSKRMQYPVLIRPFASGLAEVRKAAGRKI